MGKLRKIGRKIDRGIRKVFGKDGWLKAAATVAAIYFAAPVFGSGTMSFKPAVTPTVTVSPVPAAHTRGRPDNLLDKISPTIEDKTKKNIFTRLRLIRRPLSSRGFIGFRCIVGRWR